MTIMSRLTRDIDEMNSKDVLFHHAISHREAIDALASGENSRNGRQVVWMSDLIRKFGIKFGFTGFG